MRNVRTEGVVLQSRFWYRMVDRDIRTEERVVPFREMFEDLFTHFVLALFSRYLRRTEGVNSQKKTRISFPDQCPRTTVTEDYNHSEFPYLLSSFI